MRIIALVLSILMSLPLFGRENDPFTRRHIYEGKMPDILPSLDVKTNALLQEAVNSFNIDHCENRYTQERREQLLAFYIYKTTAAENETKVEPKIPSPINLVYALSKKGLGPLQRWIREEVEKKYVINVADNIYSNVYLLPDRYFETFTILVDDVYIGPDKIDHFFDQGYTYYKISEHGRNPAKAIEHGVDGEYSYFGLRASGVFSFADLKSNFDGYQFYTNLFDARDDLDPLFKVNEHGCVQKMRKFSWRNWVSWQWDELYNPSYYKASILKKIRRNFSENMVKHEYCKSYAHSLKTGAYGYKEMRSKEYLSQKVPEVVNIFKIDYLCSNLQTAKPEEKTNEKTN